MYIIHTQNLIDTPSIGSIPEGEVRAFLEEWFDDKSYMIGHTSGSTGVPKEIQLHKEDMRASARLTNAFFKIGSESVLLLCLSVSYIAGKMMIVRALEAGADLWVVKVGSHPLQELQGWEAHRKIDLAAMVPVQVDESLKEEAEKAQLANVRQLLIGGAPVSDGVEQQLQSLPTRCFATYGMTETVSHVALKELNGGDSYFALDGVSFSLNERGCLVIRASHLQAQCFVTNDLVELEDSTHFKWLGRYDHVINSGGIKFFPEMIERKIAPFFSSRFFISSQPDERLGQQIILVVEGDFSMIADDLLRQFQSILSPYEFPRLILSIPHFRETPTGKVIRDVEGAIPVFRYAGGKMHKL